MKSSSEQEGWWTNLVFITNLVTCVSDEGEVCQTHLWTVSTEFQMYLFTPFVAYVFVQNNSGGILLAIGILVAGVLQDIDVCDDARGPWLLVEYYTCGMLASFSYAVGAR
jgi:peptidoglycan/LPS O-acetylase OafA/YrhL